MAKAYDSIKDKQTRKGRINKLNAVILVLVLLVVGGGYFGYTQYDDLKKENQKLSDPQEAAKAETERIKKEIAELIEVPQDETPTIATVVDPAKLGNQEFFKKAQKDDRVIIYAQAKKAILYRPSTKKIIEVAPLNIGNTTSTSGSSAPEATTPATADPGAVTPAQ